jgi:YHS domain-containing protein
MNRNREHYKTGREVSQGQPRGNAVPLDRTGRICYLRRAPANGIVLESSDRYRHGGRWMKRLIILLLVAVVVASCGGSKKEEPAGERTVEQGLAKGAKKMYLIDPVSKNPVDVMTSPYSYVYKDVEYNFESEKNLKAFMKDPDKYIEEIEKMNE